jgi:toxin ParE1/3/4
MQVIYHRLAEEELVHAAQFYEQALLGLGTRFLDSVDVVVQRVQQNYEWFEIIEEDIRRASVPEFPYSLFFRLAVGDVRILAVKHNSRATDYWKHRR